MKTVHTFYLLFRQVFLYFLYYYYLFPMILTGTYDK